MVVRKMRKTVIALFMLCSYITFAQTYKIAMTMKKESKMYNKIIQLYKEAFKRAGENSIEFIEMPLERAIISANKGEIDGDSGRVSGVIKKYHYTNLVEVSYPYLKTNISVYTLNKKIKEVTIKDIGSYRIIYVRGSKATEDIIEKIDKSKLSQALNEEVAIKMLYSGRGDIIVGNEKYFDDVISAKEIEDILKIKKPIHVITMHFVLNKKHRALAAKLSRILKEMDEDGTLKKIME